MPAGMTATGTAITKDGCSDGASFLVLAIAVVADEQSSGSLAALNVKFCSNPSCSF